MKKMIVVWLMTTILIVSAHAQQPAADTEMQDAMKALGALFGGVAGGGATNQTIHQRQLRELLPTELNGMKRTNVEAGKNAMLGMNLSYAQATFTKDNASIEVKISDISAMGEFIKMAQYAWTQNEMERESEDGYERTTQIDGFPAQERYDNRDKDGKIDIMVDGRFLVEASGSQVEMEKIHALINIIDLKRLAALTPQPN